MSPQNHTLTCALFGQANATDPQPGQMLEAEQTHCSLKGIPIAECTKQDGQILYKVKRLANDISVQVDWLRQRGRAWSEPSETPRWQNDCAPSANTTRGVGYRPPITV